MIGIKTPPPRPRISVALTAYNEMERSSGKWLCESLDSMLMSPDIGDIVVVNDATPDYPDLSAMLLRQFGTRVRCQQNQENLAVFGNKLTALEASRGDWVLMADSDNTFRIKYFDRLLALHPWNPDVAYVSSFGRPDFDYGALVGDWTLANAAMIPRHPCGWCLMNCGNWFVNRSRFLAAMHGIPRKRFDIWQPNYFGVEDRTPLHWRHAYDSLDSFFINKRWWLAGGTLRVVEGLEYWHRVDLDKPGNYGRGPAEKEAIGPIYLAELVDAAAGVQHGYTFMRQAGNGFYLQRDDGAVVIVNWHTGDIQVCPQHTNRPEPSNSSPCGNSAPEAASETSYSSAPLSKRARRRQASRGESPPGSARSYSDSTIPE